MSGLDKCQCSQVHERVFSIENPAQVFGIREPRPWGQRGEVVAKKETSLGNYTHYKCKTSPGQGERPANTQV